MLEQLTAEQEAMMAPHTQSWIDFATKNKEFNLEVFEKGIEQIYSWSNLPKPEIVICDSIKSAQDAANAKLEEIAKKDKKSYTREFIPFTNYGSLSDYGWVAFYEFFQKIGQPLGEAEEKFNIFKDFIKAGHWDMLTFDTHVFVCMKPKNIFFNAENRLHNTSGMAIEWNDGYGQYYINGRSMPSWIFEKHANGTLTKEDFINQDDEEIKAGIYEVVESKGEGSMLTFLGAKEVDRHTFVHTIDVFDDGDVVTAEDGTVIFDNRKVIGYKDVSEEMVLYKTTETFSEEVDLNGNSPCPLAWLKMTCPSTAQVFLIPTDSSFNTVEEAAKYARPDGVPVDLEYKWHQMN